MPGQPISVSEANAMAKEYVDYMRAHGIDMNHQTQCVSFTGGTLTTWLGQVMPFADELRIFMGMYPPGHPHAGRTSVILWPYKNGQPALDGAFGGGGFLQPFNDGSGSP